VLEGDAIELRWTVTDVVRKENLKGSIIVLEGTATNASGLVCSRGTTELLLQH
jgi:hypothetical protein